jgi:hypothetical protein
MGRVVLGVWVRIKGALILAAHATAPNAPRVASALGYNIVVDTTHARQLDWRQITINMLRASVAPAGG